MSPGYTAADLTRLHQIAPGGFAAPEDIRRVIDGLGYLDDWRESYRIRSVRSEASRQIHGAATSASAPARPPGLMT